MQTAVPHAGHHSDTSVNSAHQLEERFTPTIAIHATTSPYGPTIRRLENTIYGDSFDSEDDVAKTNGSTSASRRYTATDESERKKVELDLMDTYDKLQHGNTKPSDFIRLAEVEELEAEYGSLQWSWDEYEQHTMFHT